MTRFTFQGTGQTSGDGGIKALGILAAVGIGGVIAWKALSSAASALGDLLVIIPVSVASLAVGALVTYVAVKARRPRQPVSAVRPSALWQVRADALPPREVRAITPAPVVTVNIGADLLAGLADLMAAAQRQPQAPVIVQSEQQEIAR